MLKNQKGSLTVEAAIVLPIFLCAVISIAFLIKAAFVHEVIQHAISETANELSTYSYVLAASEIYEVDKLADEGLKARAQEFNNHLDSYMEGYNALKEFPGDVKSKLDEELTGLEEGNVNTGAIDGLKGDYEDVRGKLEAALKNGKKAFDNPKEEIEGMLFSIGGAAYDKTKSTLLSEITKYFIQKYLKTEKIPDIDRRLKTLNVEGGLSGLDFSRSQLFSDGKSIDIIVQYRLNLALPYSIMPDIYVCQRAYSRAWMKGDDMESKGQNGEDGQEKDGSIWDLPPLQRGEKIQREHYGRNTPKFFKVLTSFENGTATRVASIDTRSLSYKKPSNLKSAVKSDIGRLDKFNGDSRDGFTVREEDIKKKILIIVVPKGQITAEQLRVLEQCKKEAAAKNIEVRIDEL